MLVTFNNDPTKLFKQSDLKLLAECDDVRPYQECGWYCVAGYKGQRRVVHAHFSSKDDYESAMGLKESSAYRSEVASGRQYPRH
ncbi:MAG: hypothetical protein EOR63_32305 [Mesorhizobium sp.]|nr:MAG: hypothetical protein EOR63_32305 [Mesorhizobium sp.]